MSRRSCRSVGPTPTPYHHPQQKYFGMFTDDEASSIASGSDASSLGGCSLPKLPQVFLTTKSNMLSPQTHPNTTTRTTPPPSYRQLRTSSPNKGQTFGQKSPSSRSGRRRRQQQTLPSPPPSPPLTKEEAQLQRLLLEAKRHQAATARVSSLDEFQTMTFTLPAGNVGDASASVLSKHCPMTPMALGGGGGRRSGPMFRGKRGWTSSAAAGSVAAARQADRYYQQQKKQEQQSSSQSCGERMTPYLHPVVEETQKQQQNKKKRWVPWLSNRHSSQLTRVINAQGGKSTLINV